MSLDPVGLGILLRQVKRNQTYWEHLRDGVELGVAEIEFSEGDEDEEDEDRSVHQISQLSDKDC